MIKQFATPCFDAQCNAVFPEQGSVVVRSFLIASFVTFLSAGDPVVS